MVDKKFYQPANITGWMVIIYEGEQRFIPANAKDMIQGLLGSFKEVGT